MNRLNMCLQTILSCKLFATLITRIFDFFMNRLNMCLQTNLLCKLFATLITRILDFFMNGLNMSYVSSDYLGV